MTQYHDQNFSDLEFSNRKRGKSYHFDRVQSNVRKAILQIIPKLRIDKISKVTIVKTTLSRDYRNLTILVSIDLPSERKKHLFESVSSASLAIRAKLKQAVNMKRIPQICIKLDEGYKKAQSTLLIIEELERERAEREGRSTATGEEQNLHQKEDVSDETDTANIY